MATIGLAISLYNDAAAAIDSDLNVLHNRWCAEIVSIRNYFEDMSLFAKQLLQDMNDEVITGLVNNVALLLFDILDDIIDIVAMRAKGNQACKQLIPPTMPHEMIEVSGRDVGRLVLFQMDRLQLSWSETVTNHITARHRALVPATDAEPDFQLAMSACDSLTIFGVAWVFPCYRCRFNKLRKFCGGLASVFPNTAPVE